MKRRLAEVLLAVLLAGAGCGRKKKPGAPGADPRDAAFAAWVHDANKATLAAARGQPHDSKWDGAETRGGARAPLGDEQKTILDEAGPAPTEAASELVIEGGGQGKKGPVRLEILVEVFPDGRVRWVTASVESGKEPGVESQTALADLAKAAPALAGMIDRTLDGLAGPCQLPLLSKEDWAALAPATLKRLDRYAPPYSMGLSDLSCATAHQVARPSLRVMVLGPSIRLHGQNRWIGVSGHVRLAAGHVVLDGVDVSSNE